MQPFAGVDTQRLLVEGMKVAAFNHRLIANNIANVDTPNYNPVRLDFQRSLRDALDGRDRVPLRRTEPRHISAQKIRAQFEPIALLSKNDYNKVDLDREMAELSKNTGRFTLYSSLLQKRFQITKGMLSNLR